MVFCAVQYKAAKNLTGKQLSELFTEYHVWEYVYTCYEALHTTGTNYIIGYMPVTFDELLENNRIFQKQNTATIKT